MHHLLHNMHGPFCSLVLRLMWQFSIGTPPPARGTSSCFWLPTMHLKYQIVIGDSWRWLYFEALQILHILKWKRVMYHPLLKGLFFFPNTRFCIWGADALLQLSSGCQSAEVRRHCKFLRHCSAGVMKGLRPPPYPASEILGSIDNTRRSLHLSLSFTKIKLIQRSTVKARIDESPLVHMCLRTLRLLVLTSLRPLSRPVMSIGE